MNRRKARMPKPSAARPAGEGSGMAGASISSEGMRNPPLFSLEATCTMPPLSVRLKATVTSPLESLRTRSRNASLEKLIGVPETALKVGRLPSACR